MNVDDSTEAASPCVLSGEDGTFAFVSLARGRYVVRGNASGFMPGVANGGHPIDVSAERTVDGIDVVLTEGGASFDGAVVDATGGPVPGARVRIVPTLSPLEVTEGEADDDGKFRIFVAAGPLVATASASGYASATVVSSAPHIDVSIILVPGSTVSGTVISAIDGGPVPEVVVSARPVGGGAELSSTSGTDGQFTIHGLAGGAYDMVGEGPHWSGSASQVVNVGLAMTVRDVVVTVLAAQSIAGTVVEHASGKPCELGWVSLRSRPAHCFRSTIATNGQVTFGGVVPGRYDVTVACGDYILREGPTVLAVGNQDVTGLVWIVDASPGLAVLVVDASGEPAPGAIVQLELPGTEGAYPSLLSASVDSSGHYKFGHLEAGEYRLSAGSPYRGEPVTVAVRQGIGDVDVTLHLYTRGAIIARVRTKAGEPVDGVSVFAKARTAAVAQSYNHAVPVEVAPDMHDRQKGGAAPSLSVNGPVFGFNGAPLGGGEYRIGPLESGSYVVEVHDDKNGLVVTDDQTTNAIDVLDGTVKTTIVVDRSGGISGCVVDTAGQPIPDVWVSAMAVGTKLFLAPWIPEAESRMIGNSQRALTDIDGRFSLSGLVPDKRFLLRAIAPGVSQAVEREVSAGDGATVKIEIIR